MENYLVKLTKDEKNYIETIFDKPRYCLEDVTVGEARLFFENVELGAEEQKKSGASKHPYPMDVSLKTKILKIMNGEA